MTKKTKKNQNVPVSIRKNGKFVPGVSGNPKGRPPDTIEQKVIKRAVKVWLKEYEQGLAEALPEISPVLISEAKSGRIEAIREVHKVVGAHKNTAPVAAVQINFGEDRDAYA